MKKFGQIALRWASWASALLAVPQAVPLWATKAVALNSDITGIYVGSMHLVDGKERDIPLSLSLTLTDETVSTPTGLEYVIDGAFVVDDEGGPYTFTKVSYDLDNNRFDMKYSRPRMDPTSTSPSSLRLVGGLDEDGGISGKVSSGVFGPIGTFKVKRDDSLHSVPFKQKYVGRWQGSFRNLRYNSDGFIEITLQPSARNTENPPGMEFDFTPGRRGGYSTNGIWIASFNDVVIDYLRRKVIMNDDEGTISIEMDIDVNDMTISGEQNSAAWGRTVTFSRLTRAGR
ncbi:MAG: hypothetical protein RIQ81_2441 [Pseudomonadota bacterium]